MARQTGGTELMTDFEHQVATVLAELMLKERRWSPSSLAPNVAAAIENSLYAASVLPVTEEVEQMSGDARRALANHQGRMAALAALRGDA